MKSDKVQKVKAIIWDMDGVLIDSEGYHRVAETETLNFYGIPITEEIAKEYSGVRLGEYFTAISKRFKTNFSLVESIERHHQVLNKYFSTKISLAEGADEVLKKLKQNFKMALATSSRKALAKIILDKFSLWKYFDETLFGEDVIKPKPNPEMFLKAAQNLRVPPGGVVVVEDSAYGFQAAKKAGMKLIARSSIHNQHVDFSLADYVITDLRDIPKILDNEISIT